MAFLLARFRLVDDLMAPLAIALNAIPIFVLVAVFNNMYPVTSEVPRRLMVTLVVYFIVLVNVARGLREVGAVYLDLMRSYAASDVAILRKVRVPHAVPYLFTALKIAAPASVITAFVSEYFGGSQNGLGSRIVEQHRPVEQRRGLGVRPRRLPAGAGVLPDGRGARAGGDAGWGRRPGAGWGMMSRPSGRYGARSPGGKEAAMRGTRLRLFSPVWSCSRCSRPRAATSDDGGAPAVVAAAVAATAPRPTR